LNSWSGKSEAANLCAIVFLNRKSEERLGWWLMMRPTIEFDPDRTCRVHDGVNDEMRDWHTGWANNYRCQDR